MNNESSLPSKQQLRHWGWKEVSIGVAPERDVKASNQYHARRKQYSLKHVGAITINKSQGDTIPAGVAIEITEENCPWEKEQVVVAFSRTRTAADMIIVGRKDFVIKKLWELITTSNQWTQMMENILQMVTINSDGPQEMEHSLNYHTHYPFRMRDATLPSDQTGYVYMLISWANPDFTYIGQTADLRNRLRQHQSGHGARGTSRPEDRPFAIAGYICGLSHYTPAQRMSLESQWRYYRNNLSAGQDTPMNILRQGERLVIDQNRSAEMNGIPERINFVCLWEQ